MFKKVDLAVIGGGPAGLAAAIESFQKGTKSVLLIERDIELGGILPQCIHDGFGLFKFKQMLTGPEYAQRYINEIKTTPVKVSLNTMVLEITSQKQILAVNSQEGLQKIQAGALILSMGCRERTRSQILLPGERPAGIYTAGLAQRYINIEGIMPGRRIVILGSGDVGLIMARRFTLEGAEVLGVYEIMPAPGGLTRNVVQCLHDYDIPLHLSHTATNIHGKKRVAGVTVAKVDGKFKPIKETEKFIPCDTLVLSVGLIPENELSEQAKVEIDPITGGPVVDELMQTSIPGIFACGNVVHVHDLVDDVSEAGEVAGQGAVSYLKRAIKPREPLSVKCGRNVSYVVPQLIRSKVTNDVQFFFRVKSVEKDVRTQAVADGKVVFQRKERIVKPPEMLKFKLKKDIINKTQKELVTGIEK